MAKTARTKVTLGGSSRKKVKANLSNTYGMKPGRGMPKDHGGVTMRKAPMAQSRIPKS